MRARAILPVYLVNSILLLASTSAANNSSATISSSSAPSASAASDRPITLWDVGFSLSDEWADLREPEECPVPPDLKTVETNVTTANDSVIEQVEEAVPEANPEPFVSFEEWKRLKIAEEDEDEEDEQSPSGSAESTLTSSQSSTTQTNSSTLAKITVSSESGKAPVQTTLVNTSSSSSIPVAPSAAPPAHRYNYASPDCSARIHSSSPQTQHASSLLHKSRDRYMLTPCKANEHWVVVELCDEIRIDAIEIAVWEFFSGVVREVRVSVGGEDDSEESATGGDKWTDVGTFMGKNVRGVQTFSLAQPTSFHRFVRLDFPSFYGTEYYCPVSQLKVYGMNQMEAFKWEQRRIKAGAKEKDKHREKEAEERRAREKEAEKKKEQDEMKRQILREKELDELEKLLHAQADRLSSQDMLTEVIGGIESMSTVLDTPPASSTSEVPMTSGNAQIDTNASITEPTASPSTTYTRSVSPRSDSSESIYAFIVRRLNALEGNSSLVSRYIEEQAKLMRHMLGRMEKHWDQWRAEWEAEDRGRWEQERMRQEDRLGRVISQLEQQRVAMDHERKTMQIQMRLLTDELGYERRRGVAQMFITLALVVIGVATRGSTIDAVLKPLLAEARRRRSIYSRKSISGPLTGLHIDMGQGRPPAIIGQARPAHSPVEEANGGEMMTSPTPTRSHVTLTRGNGSARRPGTPTTLRQRRQPSLFMPNFRSVSASENSFSPPPITLGSTSPRPRASLPPRGPGGAAPRRLARSAHLHTLEADRVRDRARHDVRHHAKTVDIGNGHAAAFNSTSPFTTEETVPDPLPIESDDGHGEWGTDQEAEASASEAEDILAHSQKDPPLSKVPDELTAELTEIWSKDYPAR